MKKQRNFLIHLGKELASVNTQPGPSLRVSIFTTSVQKQKNNDDDCNAPILKR